MVDLTGVKVEDDPVGHAVRAEVMIEISETDEEGPINETEIIDGTDWTTDAAMLEVTANETEEGMTEGEIVMIDGNLLEEMTEMFQLVKIECLANMSQRTMHRLNQKRDQQIYQTLFRLHNPVQT